MQCGVARNPPQITECVAYEGGRRTSSEGSVEIISTRAIESGDFNYLFVRKYPLVLRPVDVQAPSDCQFLGNYGE